MNLSRRSLGKTFCAPKCIQAHPVAWEDFRLLATSETWCMDGTFKIIHNGTYGSIFQALINKAAVLRGYFPNTRVQGCYFHFCQAVHRKFSELGLKARYNRENETESKMKMLKVTAFLLVLQVDTGVRLLEAGSTGNRLDLFPYFRSIYQ
ncbi:hypothetical protein T10_8992 [Trichinella papuae]|uniref:MULE transposase domain-containing protein n=1 Tax=Trichinella papuae TaxID=268474 RepID=A0A0V1MLN2_9BILA|nr:hypothetical protein T10_8992 [Trichinella papuae]